MKSFIKINPSDNVAVALQPLAKGTVIKLDNSTLTLTEEIMQGHKFALKSLKPGDSIIKYGNPIGRATAEIPAGSWIHTHNLKKQGWEIFLLIHITKLSQSFHTGSQSSSRAIAEKTVVLVYAMKSGSFLQ